LSKILNNFSIGEKLAQLFGLTVLFKKPAHIQGDQIGRIFAYWAIVYFGRVLKITEVAQNLGATCFHGTSYALILTKIVGLHFGRLFQKLVWSPKWAKIHPIWSPCKSPSRQNFLGFKIAFKTRSGILFFSCEHP
jgi:hypothetical protein